jgi:mono/diheme cytochrome c family protein
VSDPIFIAEKAPPPISGGTLLVTKSGIAVAADSDRDKVWLVDLNKFDLDSTRSVDLKENDEPGRVVEDGAGNIHVALRRGGDIVTINLASAKIIDRSPVCPAPRGMAYDAKSDVIHVACAGGELVTLPAAGGAPVRNVRLDKDLRDVVIQGDKLLVSRFRAAELLVVDSAGSVTNTQTPPKVSMGFSNAPSDFGGENGTPSFAPTSAWRMVPMAGGGVAVSHQRSLTTPVIISRPHGYGGGDEPGGGCNGGIVHPSVTTFDANGNPGTAASPVLPQAVLPVDMAVSADGNSIAVVAAGSDKVIRTSFSNLVQESNIDSGKCSTLHNDVAVPGAIAVTFWGDKLIAQSREPAAIVIIDGTDSDTLDLKATSAKDTGHDLFHKQASATSAVACASCHSEGRDDGHVWNFEVIGARRTQTLSGRTMDTAPFHWDGDMKDLGMIMDVVFVNRMGGAHQGPRHVSVMQSWMGKMPELPVSAPIASATSIQHGADLFVKANCNSCHAGALFTNNTNQDVGTDPSGRGFQVPSLLGVSNRAPFMHDGSVPTLKARFSSPGFTKHGNTANMTSADIDDMVAYLETL